MSGPYIVMFVMLVILVISWFINRRGRKHILADKESFSKSVNLIDNIDRYVLVYKEYRRDRSHPMSILPLSCYKMSPTTTDALLTISRKLNDLGYAYGVYITTGYRDQIVHVFQLYHNNNARACVSGEQMRNVRTVWIVLDDDTGSIYVGNAQAYFSKKTKRSDNTFETTISLNDLDTTLDELVTSFKIHGPDALIKS